MDNRKPSGTVTVVEKSGRKETVREDGNVPVEGVPDCRYGGQAVVRFSHGETVSPRQFFSTRVDVGIEMPCDPDFDSLDAAFKFAVDWVDERLADRLDAYAGKE